MTNGISKECGGMPCKSYCMRAYFIREQIKEEDLPGPAAEKIIQIMRQIIQEGRCKEPEELSEAVEELENLYLGKP